MKLNNLTAYFAALLLPLLYVLISRGISFPEALFGSVICILVSVYTIFDKRASNTEILEFKEKIDKERAKEFELLVSKHSTDLELVKLNLSIEYQSKIQKLEEQITKMNLEKIKRF
jgi:hypothetical protein